MIHHVHLISATGIEWIWTYTSWWIAYELLVTFIHSNECSHIWIVSERSDISASTTRAEIRIA